MLKPRFAIDPVNIGTRVDRILFYPDGFISDNSPPKPELKDPVFGIDRRYYMLAFYLIVAFVSLDTVANLPGPL